MCDDLKREVTPFMKIRVREFCSGNARSAVINFWRPKEEEINGTLKEGHRYHFYALTTGKGSKADDFSNDLRLNASNGTHWREVKIQY
jgi:hypothetical protein